MIGELKNWELNIDKLPIDFENNLVKYIARDFRISSKEINLSKITQKSLDSRKKKLKFIYSLLLDTKNTALYNKLKLQDYNDLENQIEMLDGSKVLKNPIVVGSGPAGIFCALTLALSGCNPIVIEWGSEIDERNKKYENFINNRVLDINNNLLIGEGGAGAFSDGKLYTGTKSVFRNFILKSLIHAGAPDEIEYLKRPHIGSDNLRIVTANLRKMIIDNGGSFLFNSQVKTLIKENNKCVGVELANGEKYKSPAVFIANGLGGRNLLNEIIKLGVEYNLKPFQIGCRIEHPQEYIDFIMYHTKQRANVLGAAEYHLVAKAKEQAMNVSSFCMCPGGEVVNATAWENRSISNGMSNYARSGNFANSCLIMTMQPNEFKDINEIYNNFEIQERACFKLGGGDYSLPAQDALGFLRKELSLKNIKTATRVSIVSANLAEIMSNKQYNALSNALNYYNSRYPNFIINGKFIGIESCVSSPVRIERNRENYKTSLENLYVGGEGVGHAGGIVSAATDGVQNAFAMIRNSK